MVDMFSPPKFNVKEVLYISFAWNKVCLEKSRIGTWRQMKEDMKLVKVVKRRGQKELSKQCDEQNKFIHYNKTYIDTLKISLNLLTK